MGNKKINIDNEVEMILNSASENTSMKPSPFFTTRVIGKVEQLDDNKRLSINWGMILKPGIAALIVVNLLNYYIMSNSENTEATRTESEVLLADYSYNSNSYELYESYLSGE